jgi:thiol-disulfide isomerase/thioredoxin
MEPTHASQTPAPKTKSTLDTVANIAIILVCAIAAFILIRNHFFNPNQAGGPGQRPPEIEAGEKHAALGQMVPAGAERALVVALAPGCHFCDESMPFYKRLVDERNQKGSNVKVIAAVSQEAAKAPEQQKLTAAGVNTDGLMVLDFDSVKLRGTPTILLVDNQGEVHKVWVGKQPSSGEEEILEAL